MLKRLNEKDIDPVMDSKGMDSTDPSIATKRRGGLLGFLPAAFSSPWRRREALGSADQDTADGDSAPRGKKRLLKPDSRAFLLSLFFHALILVALASLPVAQHYQAVIDLISTATVDDEFDLLDEIVAAEVPTDSVGANSEQESSRMALSAAQIISDLSEIPAPSELDPLDKATFAVNPTIPVSLGAIRSTVAVKGSTGMGVTGLDGAVDRLTYELLRIMESDPTLVVWFFDQSISLTRQRQEINERFDRIYEELGIVSEARRARGRGFDENRLLTAVVAFGQHAQVVTPRPTSDLAEIREAIDSITVDPSGIENTFTALQLGLNKFRSYRTSRGGRGDPRTIVFVVVTDERGDDPHLAEATLRDCLRFGIPVYVLGVPAPFGRATTEIKYVDPDPQYDQTPQWGETDQGPESLLPERVRLVYREDRRHGEPVVDSGFGPFWLSRLTYETGGIFFNIHPNRRVGSRISRREIDEFASDIQYFFEPDVMEKYRPDYVNEAETLRRIRESRLRSTLVDAARLSENILLEPLSTRFVKRDEASLVTGLTEAQQIPARVSHDLDRLVGLLQSVESERDTEISPRWLASYDLSYATLLAALVRFTTYNEMLAKAKRGMPFEDSKNNTWVLVPDSDISASSRLEKMGEKAIEVLNQVAERHKGTPWGLLAKRELSQPIGWKWTEEYTDLNPPRTSESSPNANPPPPSDDQRRMLPPPPPKRPLPKL